MIYSSYKFQNKTTLSILTKVLKIEIKIVKLSINKTKTK